MKTKRIAMLLVAALLRCVAMFAGSTVHDSASGDLANLFTKKGTTYIISHPHTTAAMVHVPEGCTIVFENAGSICAPIHFANTTLKGSVRLTGSTLHGSIANQEFNAAWLCHRDGHADDAACINNILAVCPRVFFPAGTYRLVSFHTPRHKLNKPYHIGINRSGVVMRGEKGSTLVTSQLAGTICIYSKPRDIANSIHDIQIKNLTFKVENESTDFLKEQEHCHTISSIGVNRLAISGCSFHNFWGDAICLNHYGDNENTGERTRNMRVTIENNTIDGHKSCNRNGVSIISGQDVMVKGNTIVRTSHSTMPGAIDIEPNCAVYTADRITIKQNIIDHSNGQNAAISLVSNKRRAPVTNVKITGNTITNSKRAIEIAVECDNTVENIKITNNTADAATDPYIFYGTGETHNWVIRNNTFHRAPANKLGGRIKFQNLRLN